jgi:hypothetical protein
MIEILSEQNQLPQVGVKVGDKVKSNNIPDP